METTQLIISIIAAIGSVASGAMLAWSIIIYKLNARQQELSRIHLGEHKVLFGISEISRIDCEREFKKTFREFFASKHFSHNIRNLYNAMQVSYKPSPIKEYIESHLIIDLQVGDKLFYRFDQTFRQIDNVFDLELKPLRALYALFNMTLIDYYRVKDNVTKGFSKNFIIQQIHDIYYEQENSLMSYEQFIEKLILKCTEKMCQIYKPYNEILEKTLSAMKLILEGLLNYNDSECIKDAKNQSKAFINPSNLAQSCQDYFKSLEEIYAQIIAICSNRELLISKLEKTV